MSSSSPRDEGHSVSFIGQATKFVSGMFGVGSSGNKKDVEKATSKNVLSTSTSKKVIVRTSRTSRDIEHLLQYQEEQEKKAARLKEMEARRQAVMAKKAEEERQRVEEEERKTREEAERRRKEREDAAKRSAKAPAKSVRRPKLQENLC